MFELRVDSSTGFFGNHRIGPGENIRGYLVDQYGEGPECSPDAVTDAIEASLSITSVSWSLDDTLTGFTAYFCGYDGGVGEIEVNVC